MEWINVAEQYPKLGERVLILWRCPQGNDYPYVDTAILHAKIETPKGTEYVWKFDSMGWSEESFLNKGGEKPCYVYKWIPITKD